MQAGNWLKAAESIYLRTVELLPGNLKIIKISDAVSFGPQPDFAGLNKRGILGLKDLPMVEVNFKTRFLESNFENAPGPRGPTATMEKYFG